MKILRRCLNCGKVIFGLAIFSSPYLYYNRCHKCDRITDSARGHELLRYAEKIFGYNSRNLNIMRDMLYEKGSDEIQELIYLENNNLQEVKKKIVSNVSHSV